MILALSDQVWLALLSTVTVAFGVLNTYLQQRNKGVTEKKADEISAALGENTKVTEATHAIVKEVSRS